MCVVAEFRAVDVRSSHQFEEEIGASSSENGLFIAKMEFSVRTGISLEQASAELDVIYHQVLRQEAGAQLSTQAEQELRARRIQLRSGLRGELEYNSNDNLRVRIVLAIVGLVLLIACVNVASWRARWMARLYL